MDPVSVGWIPCRSGGSRDGQNTQRNKVRVPGIQVKAGYGPGSQSALDRAQTARIEVPFGVLRVAVWAYLGV